MKNLYEDFANKAADVIGFGRTELESFKRAKDMLFESSLKGGEPLKNYLNYQYFDPVSENFLMAEGTAGFLLEICPLVGVNESVVKNLNQFFAKELPSGGYLQFLLIASSDIEDFLEFWQQGRMGAPHRQRHARTLQKRDEWEEQNACTYRLRAAPDGS